MYASYSCASPVQVSNNSNSSRITVILTLILGSEMALYGPWMVSWQEEHRIVREQSVFCSSFDHCEWAMLTPPPKKRSVFEDHGGQVFIRRRFLFVLGQTILVSSGSG
jgi:hypothetical protein